MPALQQTHKFITNFICGNLKLKYPNIEVVLKCILMVFPYLSLCSYINENTM